jgi:lipid II:glycine glycyltransferase (peptidoglycan interpeptide bridge formation enzyme)
MRDWSKNATTRPLGAGYVSEIDLVTEEEWFQILSEFDDASIYQTWSYEAVISGSSNVSHLVLRENGEVVAAAQARIAKLPFIDIGAAYVRWGPLYRRAGRGTIPDVFRQAVRALRNEFVCRRGLVLRVFPMLFDSDARVYLPILEEEEFVLHKEPPMRTVLMDLAPELDELREGMGNMWKRNLRTAGKQQLQIVAGSSDVFFGEFVDIYKEMVSRKKFVEPNDINQFRAIQMLLHEKFKMNILLCRSGEGVCAGLIGSAIGQTCIYLFGATSNKGTKQCGSYLLQWRLVEHLKESGCTVYNLNGINPAANPGTYKFKVDLAGKNGRDVRYLGRFDSRSGAVNSICVGAGEKARALYRRLRGRAALRRGGGEKK